MLFNLYINDLPRVTKTKTILFADDTTIIISNNEKLTEVNKYNFEMTINTTIERIINWMTSNNLRVNINKTKLMQFGTYRTNRLDLNITYQGMLVEKVRDTTFLGLRIDDNCNWKNHVSSICERLSRFAFALRRLRQLSSIETALLAYHAHVASILQYGLILWGNCTEIQSLFVMQKKCVRALTGAEYLDSCRPLFTKYKLHTLTGLYIKQICIFVKDHPKEFPVQQKVFKRQLRDRPKNKIGIPRYRLAMSHKNVYAMAVQIFNSLPDDLRALAGGQFKARLNRWLLSKCFYSLKEYLEPISRG